jgi:hypothetical protein
VLDSIVVDLLTVLEEPDWPAANFVLYILVKSMVSIRWIHYFLRCRCGSFSVYQMGAIDDRSSSAEANMVRATSIDHLGVIGARLCKARAAAPDKGGKSVPHVKFRPCHLHDCIH